MKAPDIFVPRERLDLPLGLDHDVDLQLVRDSNPRIWPIGALVVLSAQFPVYPKWILERDKSRGRVHFIYPREDEEGNKLARTALAMTDNDGRQTTSASTDGTTFIANQPTILSTGVRHEDGLVHVWWGLSTVDLSANEIPDNLISWINYSDDPTLREWDKTHFAKC